MSSNITRGDISRAGIINHFLPLLQALLKRRYYSREGLIWGNTVYLELVDKLDSKSILEEFIRRKGREKLFGKSESSGPLKTLMQELQ